MLGVSIPEILLDHRPNQHPATKDVMVSGEKGQEEEREGKEDGEYSGKSQ